MEKCWFWTKNILNGLKIASKEAIYIKREEPSLNWGGASDTTYQKTTMKKVSKWISPSHDNSSPSWLMRQCNHYHQGSSGWLNFTQDQSACWCPSDKVQNLNKTIWPDNQIYLYLYYVMNSIAATIWKITMMRILKCRKKSYQIDWFYIWSGDKYSHRPHQHSLSHSHQRI